MARALLLIAHGSRMDSSNDEVRALTARVRALTTDAYAMVDCAFLELADPTIGDGIERLIAHGAEQIAVLPYFLAAGRHVTEDIPAEVSAKSAEHPAIAIELLPYIGTAEAMPQLLADMIPASDTPPATS
ncbi:CbiX/SirB N-terminal domain-containing protein [Salinisphaera sp. USBA-960]|uniref:sirohydrochlorin chelatase n=1 Tax=Salinisphaera orenii TaxID=856731 RepID=UPI000DBE0755|nr:CbiX/SirB N-terminal domain-containing protein [Salifodinibacter halophilus]NNC26725.1 CbiX/SirB N-terminal domain-containing protein [Salifodinibacter halophilus]